MMRIITVLAFLPWILAGQVTDTTEVIKRLQVGAGYGIMQHEVAFTPNAAVEALSGSSIGVHLRYFDNALVGFQAEVSYVTSGWKEEIDPSFSSLYERQTNYVELQLMTQLSIGKGVIQPMLQAGPYLSIPLSEEEQLPPEYLAPEDPALPPYYGLELPFRLNYGLQAGAGLNVELGPLTIQVEGRYLTGFN
ncbi:MAG: porin family protein, partial [Bacteroidota bacterium]